MKTLEEVKEHISKIGYTEKAIERICGFLIGKELKDEKEYLCFFKGTHEFSDFLNWFKDSSTDYFQRKDVEKAEVYYDTNIEPIVSINVVNDNIFEEILKEIGLKKEEKPKYKYTGEEREELIKRKEAINWSILGLKNKHIGSLIKRDIFKSFEYACKIDEFKKDLKNIEAKLHETVD